MRKFIIAGASSPLVQRLPPSQADSPRRIIRFMNGTVATVITPCGLVPTRTAALGSTPRSSVAPSSATERSVLCADRAAIRLHRSMVFGGGSSRTAHKVLSQVPFGEALRSRACASWRCHDEHRRRYPLRAAARHPQPPTLHHLARVPAAVVHPHRRTEPRPPARWHPVRALLHDRHDQLGSDERRDRRGCSNRGGTIDRVASPAACPPLPIRTYFRAKVLPPSLCSASCWAICSPSIQWVRPSAG